MATDRWDWLRAGIHELREQLEGQPVTGLNESLIDEPLRALVPDAHALGASDEAVQADIAALLTNEYVDDLEERIERVREPMDRWLQAPVVPIGYERVAFINMQMVLDSFWSLVERAKKGPGSRGAPAAPAPARHLAVMPAVPTPAGTELPDVLVVQPDDARRREWEHHISRTHLRVRTANSASEALSRFRDRCPQLTLVDTESRPHIETVEGNQEMIPALLRQQPLARIVVLSVGGVDRYTFAGSS